MTSIVVIQARTSSSRLPAKVLLPIKTLPMVVLAAQRAANTGKSVRVVTSIDPSDDHLCSVLTAYSIPYFRGSLQNTLERFVSALADLADDTLVFRLTADNVFPDGHLIDELEADFIYRQLDYLACNGHEAGLPYGMSAEVTYLRHLREAHNHATTLFDQEHVTPYIRRTKGEVYFKKYHALAKGNYRCTVDTFDDYLVACKVFEQVDDPVAVTALQLIDRLVAVQEPPLTASAVNKLVLGGAQLGWHYGIANVSGKPSLGTVEALVKQAISIGVDCIDTARAYGDSEAVLGTVLTKGWESRAKVITKLSPLAECPEQADSSVVNAFVGASVYQSCVRLNRTRLDVLLLHRAAHVSDWRGAVWQSLLHLRSQGVIQQLGVSVQNPAELEVVLDNPDIAHIQMPFNILDHRWHRSIDKIQAIKAQRNLTIHIRSAFLQGLLICEDERVWQKAHCVHSKPVKDWLQQQAIACGCVSVKDLCLSYVRSIDWIDGVVVGMETLGQLQENARLFLAPLLTEQQLQQLHDTQPQMSDDFLNPAKWHVVL